MFTGIVEEMGRLERIDRFGDSARVRIAASRVLEDISHGASIAVDGCCLTTVAFDGEWFEADVMHETLLRTTLGSKRLGDSVNLERPVAGTTRLGGHVVQGHVDGVGEVQGREQGERWEVVTIAIPERLAPYLVEKGSICVDGVSLTVVEVSPAGDAQPWFTVSLIPETLSATTLGHRAVGEQVNIEVDILAKHVERLLAFAKERA